MNGTAETIMTTIAQLDSRKRLNLAPFAKSDFYLVTTEPSGRITLEPADVVSRLEQSVLENVRIMSAVAEARADSSGMELEQR